MKRLMLSILLLATAVASAADFKLTNGTEYRNVTVSRVEPDGIMVVTGTGIVKLFFADLPKPVQEKYHYDPSAAQQFRAHLDAAGAAVHAQGSPHNATPRFTTLPTQSQTSGGPPPNAQNVSILSTVGFNSGAGVVFALAITAFGVCLYFLPAFIGRRKQNFAAILVLNLLTGWTFVDWVIALVWACTKDGDSPASISA